MHKKIENKVEMHIYADQYYDTSVEQSCALEMVRKLCPGIFTLLTQAA